MLLRWRRGPRGLSRGSSRAAIRSDGGARHGGPIGAKGGPRHHQEQLREQMAGSHTPIDRWRWKKRYRYGTRRSIHQVSATRPPSTRLDSGLKSGGPRGHHHPRKGARRTKGAGAARLDSSQPKPSDPIRARLPARRPSHTAAACIRLIAALHSRG